MTKEIKKISRKIDKKYELMDLKISDLKERIQLLKDIKEDIEKVNDTSLNKLGGKGDWQGEWRRRAQENSTNRKENIKTLEEQKTKLKNKKDEFEKKKKEFLGYDKNITEKLTIEKDIFLKDKVNNSSLVLKLTYLDKSVLFSGDMETEGWELIPGAALDANILKVSHHGSKTGLNDAILKNINPSFAVISLDFLNGKNIEKYHFPNAKIIEMLKIKLLLDEGRYRIFRTDDGTNWHKNPKAQGLHKEIAVRDYNEVDMDTKKIDYSIRSYVFGIVPRIPTDIGVPSQTAEILTYRLYQIE